jgi:hypothetical protein
MMGGWDEFQEILGNGRIGFASADDRLNFFFFL